MAEDEQFHHYPLELPKSLLQRGKKLSSKQNIELKDLMVRALEKGMDVEEMEAMGMETSFVDPISSDQIYLTELQEARAEELRAFHSVEPRAEELIAFHPKVISMVGRVKK